MAAPHTKTNPNETTLTLEQQTMLSLSSPSSSPPTTTTVFIIFFSFFFSLLHPTTSLPSHAPLSLCHNTTFTCGTITNLSYPFTGGNLPSFCGPPQFHLTCNDSVPLLNISSLSYRVIKLDSASQSLTLARVDLWNETCTHVHLNSTFEGASFSYGFGNQNLTLFYGCGPLSSSNTTPINLFHCESYKNKSDSYSLVGPFPLDPVLSVVECELVVEVPILQKQAKRLIENRSLLKEVLMEGFNVSYSNPYEDQCVECVRIGGRCGFDSDSDESICICGDRLCPSSGSSSMEWNWKIMAVIGASVAVGGVLVVFGLIISYRKRYFSLAQRRLAFEKTGSFASHNVEDFINSYGFLAPKRHSYSEVKRITNSFRHQLGQGGYGVVYKGSLPDGRNVAVKVISEFKGSGEEFINEVASISRTSHVNIVSLFGFCNEMNKRALIYEFMPNGSLDKFIYKVGSSNAICDLAWNTLYQITISIARGLEYLHRGCSTRILHLDIKPQNILLDEDFCPKIADFGLAKICKKKESIVSILGTRGTPGYIAPEVFSRTFGGVSHKSDVYSYGMLILEVVGGRKNYDNGGSNTSELYFLDWIYKDLDQGNIPTTCLVNTEEENDMVMKITLVSLWCIQANPSARPSMSKVVEMLEGPLQSVPYPPKPVLKFPEWSPLQLSDISYSSIHETDSISLVENSSIK